MTSQITELQNQNAQLIEDHTRDVLQIKAKETQLVRARSDAENAEERANSLSKEIDRLKRELSRLGRDRASSDAPNEASTPNGDLANAPSAPSIRPAYGISRSYNVPSARAYGGDGFGEGKENIPDSGTTEYSKLSGVSVPHPPVSNSSRPMSNGSSGRATPASAEGDNLGGGGSQPGLSRNSSTTGEGVESWRRAAEVTQNLKARIEMMKVSHPFEIFST